jgi:predicted ribosomally synthesized peptide with nif11-like leader
MSVQTAMQFIRKVREDESLRDQLKALGQAAELESVVQIGAAAGFDFTIEDIRTAFKHDWAMRWVYYGGEVEKRENTAAK